MAEADQIPGQILADIPVRDPPWSPWLRLAHICVYPKGETVPPPRRLRDWEMILQLEGGSWVWWDRLRSSEPLAPGDLVLVPPGEIHAHGQVGSHLAVHFDLTAQPGLVAMDMIERLAGACRRADGDRSLCWRLRTPGGLLATIPAVTRLAAPEAWRERFDPLVHQWLLRRHDEPAARLQAAGLIASALHDLIGETGSTRGSAGQDIAHLLTQLDLDGRRWTVAGLAHRVGMAETAFRSAFRRLTGESPRAWLERHRFERARHQLLTTTQPINRIATACGYDDPFHFSRVCRRLTGTSPRELRRRG